MITKLRIGVIGAGNFAETCHVPGINSHPQAEVIALCGRRYHQARAMADRLGVPDIHTDYRELCNRPDIDAVTISTPNAEHVEPAIMAFRNQKHVFCEKPLAMTVSEANQMLLAAQESGKVHQVGFTFRYLYGVRELQRRLRQGEIGEPHYLRIQYDGWTRKAQNDGWVGKKQDQELGECRTISLAGGGMLYNLGSHLFDISRFILGPFEAITGFYHNISHQRADSRVEMGTDDIAAAWFRHTNGVRGQLFVSRATPPLTDNGYLEIIGTKGALKASLSRGSIDVLKVSRPAHPAWKEIPLPEAADDGKSHCLGLMMRSFVDSCLCGKLNRDTDASFEDGLAVQEAIAAIDEANGQLRWVGFSNQLE